MAVYEILKMGDPVLREKAKPVTRFNSNLGRLIDDMFDTMAAARGVGLAAPQIGIGKRVCVVEVGKRRFELVNPEIIEAEGEQCDAEGCLSIPDYTGSVKRFQRVRVKAQDRNGETFIAEGTDLLAVAFQHEIDHLDGILFVDRVENDEPEE
ncbi:peptide deformylase [Heliobacterium undosum]|uniref:Peptide deformylase n=1 Tax=Heliomicrobium undosum TaxID=121734 RepID=A0A845KYN7_9FIRM|nr:peptide deformylase [Heliomicrobium undosum]MZP29047.1 peptide deformylase [Heliomicrobium undosum]